MIKLTKLEIPDVLRDNSVDWTNVLLERAKENKKPSEAEKSRYRHPDIKAVLIKETNGKCAYCESKLLHVAYGDVEHIAPKSTKIEATFEWENLTLACDVCNTNKGNKFSNGIGFIDPYLHAPDQHFNVLGALILAKPGDDDARLTEETLQLNRAELVERRDRRIRSLREQVEVIKRAPAALRDILLINLNDEMESDKEFSAIARACLPLLLT